MRSSMHDGKGGVKVSPVIVKILFKRVRVFEAHTIGLLCEENCLLLFIPLRNGFGAKVPKPRYRIDSS